MSYVLAISRSSANQTKIRDSSAEIAHTAMPSPNIRWGYLFTSFYIIWLEFIYLKIIISTQIEKSINLS